MKPYYLKFEDEVQAIKLLADFRNDGGWITASISHALDVVGVITEGGSWDDAGNEVEAPTVLDGFHVNMMIDVLPTELEQYQVTPNTPVRVFAGVQ